MRPGGPWKLTRCRFGQVLGARAPDSSMPVCPVRAPPWPPAWVSPRTLEPTGRARATGLTIPEAGGRGCRVISQAVPCATQPLRRAAEPQLDTLILPGQPAQRFSTCRTDAPDLRQQRLG